MSKGERNANGIEGLIDTHSQTHTTKMDMYMDKSTYINGYTYIGVKLRLGYVWDTDVHTWTIVGETICTA